MNIHGKSIILRHSIREVITDSKNSFHQKLTQEGINLANELGQSLSLYSDHFML